MGISRDSRHKRRLTGGKMPVHQKKRKFESARPVANTRIGEKRIRLIRTRGGNHKFRALRLDHGNFTWQSEGVTRKVAIKNVVYNASNNELVRTKTLVKNSIILIDAHPFVNYIQQRYNGIHADKLKEKEPVQKIKDKEAAAKHKKENAAKLDGWETLGKDQNTKDVKDKYLKRRLRGHLNERLVAQLHKGTLFACITSRPGQSGRCDGYVLEGKELEFYQKKMHKK